MENNIKKIIIANAVLSNENFNKVKEISLPNGDIKTIGLFSKQYIATFVDAVTGAGFVSSEQREEKLLLHNTKRIRKSKVQNAVSAALLSADKNGKEAVKNLQMQF